MQYLKQSTAATLKIGPFIDDTDGKTAETGLTIAQADVRLSKNGGNIAQKTEATSCTHDELGIYGCPIDATDTGTLGRLQLFVHESGALPVWHEFMVVTANVYDSLCSTDILKADLVQINNSTTSQESLKDFTDVGYNHATSKVQGVVLADTVTTLTGHTVQTGNSYARLGTPAAENIAADLVIINDLVDDLESRLSAARAGYLDNLSAGAVALASVCTETRLAELAAANLPADIDVIKAKTDNLPSGIAKNVALSNFGFYMVLSSDHVTAATGKTVTGTISKDGAAFASLTNAISEIANGMYKVNLTQAEMNADVLTLKFTEINCDQRIITIYTG